MSTSGIGSSVPGFDVLFPSGEPWASTSATNATYATAPATSTSTASSGSSSSTDAGSSSTSSDGLNPYQQQLATLEQWQSQILQESLFGDTSGATNALYASAGLSADQFANLATELQNLQSTSSTGNIVNTSA